MTKAAQEQNWTLGRILSWSKDYLAEKGSESARLDAELLIANAIGCSRIQLYTNFDQPVLASERSKIRELLLRRANDEPVAYILQKREFMGRVFKVSEDTLIPRPDTELVVETAAKIVHGKEGSLKILDVGTGSGCIGVSLALDYQNVAVDLLDVSSEALAIAEENVVAMQASNVREIICKDILQSYEDLSSDYDLIVSNPPYISQSERQFMSEEVLKFEPDLALYGSNDGLEFYEFFATKAPSFLKPGGTIILEMGFQQADAVQKLFASEGQWENISLLKDLAGHERVIKASLRSDDEDKV